MKHLLTTQIGRLRIIGWLEGMSLLILIFIAVPLKYIWGNPVLTKSVGMLHGVLFLLFIFNTMSVGVGENWRFKVTTWKVLIACIIPFGTFYVDRKILAKIPL